MSRLTRGEAGRSDNNEAGETPYSDASMAEESGQCLSIGQGGAPTGIFKRFTADVPTRHNESTGLMRRIALSFP
jgi:hypothetical protein